ncbi:MAG TPA: alpha/beta hydrolase [Clostridiaceae bacterium]|nr:alpha/beta hydrolase [Clostridiaceae bacterium]
MIKKTEYYSSSDGKTDIYVAVWEPDSEPIALLQIVHGMVEFIDRYDRFARVLAEQGILVAGNDHLGHGYSVRSKTDWGYFADYHGNRCVLEDMRSLYGLLQSRYPDTPCFMMGHSMGSYLVRQYLHVYPTDKLDGIILTGAGVQPKALIATALALAKFLRRVQGKRHRSQLLTKMALGNNNRFFKPNRTPCDWLTRDDVIVDAYMADERNQFCFTTGAFVDMFTGFYSLYKKKNLALMDRETPVMIANGDHDPVGDMGKAAPKLYGQFKDLGFDDVVLKQYEDARHEIINEINSDEVDRDIIDFILSRAKNAIPGEA